MGTHKLVVVVAEGQGQALLRGQRQEIRSFVSISIPGSQGQHSPERERGYALNFGHHPLVLFFASYLNVNLCHMKSFSYFMCWKNERF